jgi:molecular chaperone HtpG
VEVLLLSDPVDEFWIERVGQFDGKPFKSITRGAADLDDIKAAGAEEKNTDKADTSDISGLIVKIKLELGEAIKDVRASKRLTESPVCLIADEGDIDVNLERLLRRHGQMTEGIPESWRSIPTTKSSANWQRGQKKKAHQMMGC